MRKHVSRYWFFGVAAAVILLQGCAAQFNPIGETKFDCNRKQDAKSSFCRSFKSVDASTIGELPRSRFDKEFNMREFDRLTGISPDDAENVEPTSNGKNGAKNDVVLPHQVRQSQPLTGMPVREGPVVQRVWIKRFVDGSDLLTETTVVYKEIKGTRWAGTQEQVAAQAAKNIYPRKPVDQSADTLQASPSKKMPQVTSKVEFSQPGSDAEASESAFDPAVSGSASMPK